MGANEGEHFKPEPGLRFAEHLQKCQVVAEVLPEDGLIPNNKLPLLIYAGALQLPARNAARLVEEILASNRWRGCWRNGIYSFHHYHSTAHEVLVVYGGSANVLLGGQEGRQHAIHAGDVLIIPAGVGHKNLGASDDFAVAGAYPDGQQWDMCYGKKGERPQTDENISRVPLPKSDPVFGANGPLRNYWRR